MAEKGPLQTMGRTSSKWLNRLGPIRLDNPLRVYHSEPGLPGAFIVDSLNDFAAQDHPRPVVIVLDSGLIHRYQLVYDQQLKWETAKGYLFFLPTYIPHLNHRNRSDIMPN